MSFANTQITGSLNSDAVNFILEANTAFKFSLNDCGNTVFFSCVDEWVLQLFQKLDSIKTRRFKVFINEILSHQIAVVNKNIAAAVPLTSLGLSLYREIGYCNQI